MEELALLLSQIITMGNVACTLVSICCIVYLFKQGFKLVHFMYTLNKKLDDIDSIILSDKTKSE